MPYTLYTQNIVKIWLSPDPDEYINLENRLRLIRLRTQNKNANIFLVYAKSLLSEKSQSNLYSFCQSFNLQPISVEDDVIPKCKNHLEEKLIECYKLEINNLDNGGNLGAASDILRWVCGVYRLGIYSDLDMDEDLKNTPYNIQVESAILCNLLSVGGGIGICNNIISVQADCDLLLDIQNRILSAYRMVDRKFSYADADAWALAYRKLDRITTNYSAYNEKMLREHLDGRAKNTLTPVEVRALIQKDDLSSLALFLREVYFKRHKIEFAGDDVAIISRYGQELRKEMLQKLAPFPENSTERSHRELLFVQRLLRIKENYKLAKFFFQIFKFDLIKHSVILTTGPGVLQASLCKEVKNAPLDAKVLAKYSITATSLAKAFKAQGTFGLTKELAGDLSWLSAGVKKIQQREVKFIKSANTIHRFYQSSKLKRTINQRAVLRKLLDAQRCTLL